VTPELQAVYDELLERATQPSLFERSRRLRDQFAERCGKIDPDDTRADAREAAAWEDVLVRGGMASEIASLFADRSERELAESLGRAQRGVFIFERKASRIVAHDLWQGADFFLVSRDHLARELALQPLDESPICEGRLLGGYGGGRSGRGAIWDGCVMLPGTVFHPTAARDEIEEVLEEARRRGLRGDVVLDALLRMEHVFMTLSRVKARYAYRLEALARGL
jgi:hypothetical protein